MEEPEVMIQEAPPEISQPKQPTVPGEIDFMEMFKMVMEKIEESRKSTKEDSQNLKADLNRMEEGLKSTDQKMDKSIESLKEDNRSLKADLSQKIEEGQKDNQKHIELLKEEFNNQISAVSYTHLDVYKRQVQYQNQCKCL